MSNILQLHPRLVQCNTCKQYKYKQTDHPYYPDCKIIQCLHCATQWCVCVIHKQRFNSNVLYKLKNHFDNKHPSLATPKNITDDIKSILNTIDDIDNNYSFIDDDDVSVTTEANCNPCTKKFKNSTCTDLTNKIDNDSSTTYIYSNTAIKKVIGIAFSTNKWCPVDMTTEEMEFHLGITEFCCNMTEAKQKQFSHLLNQLVSINFNTTRPPTSIFDLQKLYLSGKHSIYKNIPVPKVIEIDSHAYVSLEDILRFLLSTIDNICIIQSSCYEELLCDNITMSSCRKAKDIIKHIKDRFSTTNIDPYVLFITLWSDDFEVNHTRRNRNSTWIKTVTLASSPDMSTSKSHTHIISLGQKGSNHSIVNTQINTELLSLQHINYYYVHQLKDTIPLVVYPIAVLADRPERCALNHTLSYSGNSTRRWLYSSLTSPNKIASCLSCFKKRVNMYFSKNKSMVNQLTKCNRCCDFDFTTRSTISKFKAPPNYPSTKHPSSPSFPKGRDIIQHRSRPTLSPVKISYPYLVAGMKAACYNFHTKQWRVIETRTYLKLLGVSTALTNMLMEYVTAQTHMTITTEDVCDQMPLPQLWTDKLLDIDQFLETPMHHLFEGIIKSLIEVTMEYLKFYKHWTQFCDNVNPILDEIESLKCDFCRVEPFWQSNKSDYKPTGWIAENYLGYCRIIVYLLLYMNRISTENWKGYNEFCCMIQSAFVLISQLMSHSQDSDQSIEDLIHIFLGTCSLFDSTFGLNESTNPFWYRKSNFISLLNLPAQIEKFGPIYLYWEGVKERYIQHIKPILKNKRKSVTYLTTKLQQLMQQNALQLLQERGKSNQNKNYKRYNDIFVYTNRNALKHAIQNHDIVTVVIIYNTNEYDCMAITKMDDMYVCHPILFNDDVGYHKFNLWFAPITLSSPISKPYTGIEEIIRSSFDVGLLIPDKSKELSSNFDYPISYLITSKNWYIRTQSNTFNLPKLSQELFRHINTL